MARSNSSGRNGAAVSAARILSDRQARDARRAEQQRRKATALARKQQEAAAATEKARKNQQAKIAAARTAAELTFTAAADALQEARTALNAHAGTPFINATAAEKDAAVEIERLTAVIAATRKALAHTPIEGEEGLALLTFGGSTGVKIRTSRPPEQATIVDATRDKLEAETALAQIRATLATTGIEQWNHTNGTLLATVHRCTQSFQEAEATLARTPKPTT